MKTWHSKVGLHNTLRFYVYVKFIQCHFLWYFFIISGGNCNTILVANIWGEAAQIEETISTLRFAIRMMCITVEPAINEFFDPVLLVKKLSKEIKHLKHELAMHDTLVRILNKILKPGSHPP